MRYTYEAVFEYSAEDGVWYVDFPGFDGSAYTDGVTLEAAASNAADALTLVICDYLEDGRPLPEPTFHLPPHSVVSVEVNDETIALSKCMTVTDAAEMLNVTPSRVSQLLNAGKLEAYMDGGVRLVTIASVNARMASRPRAGRPKGELGVSNYNWG